MTTRTPGSKTTPSAGSGTRTQTRKAPGERATARAPAKRVSAPAANKPARRSASAADAAGGGFADSPILPVDQLDALRKIKPGAVDWVIEQTQLEAEHRRAERVRVNNLIFVEHLFAQVSALLIGISGIGGGVWLAIKGQPWVGFAIIAVVMVALAVVQVSARGTRQ